LQTARKRTEAILVGKGTKRVRARTDEAATFGMLVKRAAAHKAHERRVSRRVKRYG